ncbi:extracellular trypsin protease [Plectosphaerella plurivora]|uniref:Extracellular trypsin protease n=1 Tax=Plectosphaerella plurivora TaxID=936078 RepID=A0A9P9ADX3_9PEZI|nr:extracellular trypsin protease [Plectosphaerella plurivora]
MRFAAFVVRSIFTASSLALPQPQSSIKIVGGNAAEAGEFPFIVSLQRRGNHFCGGTLLNENTVLTAAHCSSANAASVSVRAGSLVSGIFHSGGILSEVSSIEIHPQFDIKRPFDSDVAIWKLSTPIPKSQNIGYATLAAADSDPTARTLMTAAGWGTTAAEGRPPDSLRKVDVPVIGRNTCRGFYGNDVTGTMFCAGLVEGGKDSCQGDSGGPLIDANTKTLMGVVSWGRGCADARSPGVYARVDAMRSFIDQFM